MFALVMLTGEAGSVNLKCDPDWALELRATYAAVRPGYHTEQAPLEHRRPRRHPRGTPVREMIDHSYELVVAKLTGRNGHDFSKLSGACFAACRQCGDDAPDQRPHQREPLTALAPRPSFQSWKL